MKEICLIAAYTPDIERQDVLRELVRDLKRANKKILLVTHSQTPQDIIGSVDYHFYDSENEFLTDNKYKVWFASQLDQQTIVVSQDVVKYSAAVLPCTRNLWFGLTIAKSLGYDCAHYIEYDSKLLDTSIIDQNTELMSEYDGVYYTDNAEWQIRLPEQTYGDTHLYGAYSVYNLNSYTFDQLIWNREKILSEYEKGENSQLVERVTEKLLIGGKKFFVKSKNDLIENGLRPNLLNKGSNSKPIDPKIFFIENENLKLYFLNKTSDVENIEVIVNNEKLFRSSVSEENHYKVLDFGPVSEIKHIKLYKNNEFIREYDLSTEENIENLKKYNHVRRV